MPINVIELASSRRISYNSGSPIGTRVFTVTGAATEADVYGLFKLDGEPPTNLPQKFSAYPVLSSLVPPVRLVALDFELTKDPDVLQKWDVTVTYREVSIGGGGPAGNPLTELAPNDEGYLNVRGQTEALFTDVWRAFYTDDEWRAAFDAKANGSFGVGVPIYQIGTENSDIGGLSVDVSGRPVSIETLREQITVDLTLSYIPDIDRIRKFAGSRNASAILGCPAGSVVFKGANWSNLAPGKWSVSYEFAADNFFHLIQAPAQDDYGKPVKDARGQAKIVSWVQPFMRIIEHRELNPYLIALP